MIFLVTQETKKISLFIGDGFGKKYILAEFSEKWEGGPPVRENSNFSQKNRSVPNGNMKKSINKKNNFDPPP